MSVANLLPIYVYFMESIDFSPFFGYGIICLFTAYCSRYFEEIKSHHHPLIVKDIELDDT